jgi:hypothetical protein
MQWTIQTNSLQKKCTATPCIIPHS